MIVSKEKYFFSIIIPVYNVENYLERCLDSVVNQEFSFPIEIIAVDDASTDSSLQILCQYQSKFPNLKIVVNAENSKLSFTRLEGIKLASGRYVLHVDSDDWIVPGTLTGLYNYLSLNDVDVLVFNYERHNIEGNVVCNNAIIENKVHYEKQKVLMHFFGACWNKAVKRELLDDLVYGKQPINSQEDLIYSLEILLKAKSFFLLKDTYYIYFDNSSSITRIVSPCQYLLTQPIVLSEINKISNRYNAEEAIKLAVYDYMEKWIYEAITKIHFIKHVGEIQCCNKFLCDLELNSFLPNFKIIRLKKSIKNKWKCLLIHCKYSGIQNTMSIVIKGLLYFKK